VLGTRAARPPGSRRVVLLTGATGFLGSFLLRELLTRTDADVLCLVRAATEEAGRQRILDALSGWARHVEPRPERIAPLLGELSEPAFGLGEEQFCRLAAAADAVYHNGALVNFVYPYSRLRATNIEGTHEVLRFAARHCTPVHFVSTIDVYYSVGAATAGPISETRGPAEFGAPYGGYAATKWVAEQNVALAGQRGLPVTIYRPGFAVADGRSGNGNTQDFLSRMVKGCVQLGAVPGFDLVVDMTPVDFISGGIVHLSLRDDSAGQAFNMHNPASSRLVELAGWMQRRGYPLEVLPYETWRDRAFAVASVDADHPLHPVLGVFPPSLPAELTHMPDFGRSNLLAGLEGTGIVCRPVQPDLIGEYFDGMIESGFLPPPRGGDLSTSERIAL
jgi:thioester reductase-like protein